MVFSVFADAKQNETRENTQGINIDIFIINIYIYIVYIYILHIFCVVSMVVCVCDRC